MKNSFMPKHKGIKISWAFITGLILLLLTAVRISSQDTVPYIYYYSRDESAFIIQRADGTDRRLFAHYSFEEAYDTQVGIWGGGWSTSGNWFTWMSIGEGGNNYANEAYLYNNANSTILTISNEVTTGGITQTIWSPTEDILLIISNDVADVLTIVISAYDASQQTFLWRYNYPDIPRYPQQIHWSPNGRYVTITGTDFLKLIPMDGTEIVDFAAEFAAPLTDQMDNLQFWLTEERLIYPRSVDQLTIADIEAQDQEMFYADEVSGEIRLLDWSPDKRFGLVYVYTEAQLQLYLLTVSDGTMNLISNDTIFVNNLSTSTWSEDSQHAAFVSGDGDLYIAARNGSAIINISPFSDGEITAGSQIGWHDNFLFFTWYNAVNNQFQLYQYDILMDETRLSSISQDVSFFSIHQDLMFINRFLVNLKSQEVIEFSAVDALRIDIAHIDQVRWHPSANWLFLLSMYNNQYYIKPANSDGMLYTEIALCPEESLACFGWMP